MKLDFGVQCRVGLLVAACLLAWTGCGGAGVEVSGKVTLDGSPLDEATITFVPMAGGQREAGWTMVQGGSYLIPTANQLGTGQFRVEIRALRSGGSDKGIQNDPTLIAAKEIVPSKYNSKSELVAEIKPGKNALDFELKTTGP
jgi:hypothetical protein